jgi:hypothetical protein
MDMEFQFYKTKSSGVPLPNNMNVLNIAELCIVKFKAVKRAKNQIICIQICTFYSRSSTSQ